MKKSSKCHHIINKILQIIAGTYYLTIWSVGNHLNNQNHLISMHLIQIRDKSQFSQAAPSVIQIIP